MFKMLWSLTGQSKLAVDFTGVAGVAQVERPAKVAAAADSLQFFRAVGDAECAFDLEEEFAALFDDGGEFAGESCRRS